MMESASIRAEYVSISKPFIIEGRHAHCGGTDTYIIARISTDAAKLLAQEGLSWAIAEPDWNYHYREIERMKAKRDLADAQKRMDALS